MTETPLGEDGSLLDVPAETVKILEAEAREEEFSPPVVAQLPKFLRSFYLRFLDEIVDMQIERFNAEERDQISDHLVDLESNKERESVWPLLMDFVDLCDYFDDFGLLSVPEAAQEHEAEIFELSARVLYDLGWWADLEGYENLRRRARDLAAHLESLGSGAKAR